VQGDRLGPAEERQGDAAILAQLLRADLLPEAQLAPAGVRQLRALLRHRASLVRLGTQLRNRIHAVAADHGYDRTGSYRTGPGRGWLAELDLPAVSREIITDCLAVIDGLAPLIERPGRRAAPAREGRPPGQGLADIARGRRVHRPGHPRRDRGHHPVRQRPQAGQLGRVDPDGPRL
jgi:transposase